MPEPDAGMRAKVRLLPLRRCQNNAVKVQPEGRPERLQFLHEYADLSDRAQRCGLCPKPDNTGRGHACAWHAISSCDHAAVGVAACELACRWCERCMWSCPIENASGRHGESTTSLTMSASATARPMLHRSPSAAVLYSHRRASDGRQHGKYTAL